MKRFLAFALISFSVFAGEGPSVGGGGDVIILPDDSVVLADPFMDHAGTQPNNMPPLRALNPRLLKGVSDYRTLLYKTLQELTPRKKRSSEIAQLLQVLATRKNDLKFYGVRDENELNSFCASGGKKDYILPTGAKVQQVACTAGNETFLVEPLFLKLSLRDQVLLLIHERLTTLRDQYGGKNYSAVARFTTGLNVYLTFYRDQALKKFRSLTDSEFAALGNFYYAIEELEYRNDEVGENSFQFHPHQNGGGLVHNMASVDSSAFLSLNSRISKSSRIAQDVKILNSNFQGTLAVGASTLIEDSTIIAWNLDIGSNVKIKNSTIEYRTEKKVINDNQEVIGGSLSTDIDLSYFPDGYTPRGIITNIERTKNYGACEKNKIGRTDIKLSHKVSEGNWIIAEITYRLRETSGTFSKVYFCDAIYRIRGSYKDFSLTNDRSKVLVNRDGVITIPNGYYKPRMKIDAAKSIGSYDLSEFILLASDSITWEKYTSNLYFTATE